MVYTGSLGGGVPDTYTIRDDYPESISAGLNGAVLLAVSRTDQLAVLVRARHFIHREYFGTLATVSLGGGAPREILENVEEADWSKDSRAPSGNEVWFSGATSGEEYCIRAATLSGKTCTMYCGTSPTMIQDALPNGRSLVSSEDTRASMEFVEHGQGKATT